MPTQPIARYPLLHETIATMIHHILTGMAEDRSVHIGIDNYEFVKDYRKYQQHPVSWWQNHIAGYSVIDCSVAVSSIWLRLNCDRMNDIFGPGTYFYNCNAGSFEIEVSGEGVLTQIMAEFDGRTPSFIPQLLDDFPDRNYPNKDKLADDLVLSESVADKLFLDGLKPVPYNMLEID